MGNESALATAFRRFGQVLVRFPLVVIGLALVFVAGCSAGLGARPLQVDTDANKIWVPPTSITAQQKQYFDAAFDPFFRIDQVIVSVEPDAADPAVGILTPEFLQSVYRLQSALVAGATATNGITLDDVCYKPIPGKGCLVETPLDWFKSNGTVISALTTSDIQAGLACRALPSFPTLPGIPCLSSIGVPVQADVVLGRARCPAQPIPGFNASVCGSCGGTAADALILTFLLQATPALTEAGAEWEKEVFLPTVQAWQARGLTAQYMAERSISDELAAVNSQNQGTVIISYVVMLLYVACALGRTPHPVASRALLGLQGMLIVGASVASALGLAAWSGLHVTMIVAEVVPFLILAIGVDNVVLLTKGADRGWRGPLPAWRGVEGDRDVPGHMSAAEAVPYALATVGPTITAASGAEVAAFAVGVTTGIPALTQFCIVAAVAVAVDYMLQVTWYAAALYLDLRRQEAGRADVCPCLHVRAQARGEREGYRVTARWGVGKGEGEEEEGDAGLTWDAHEDSSASSAPAPLVLDAGLQRGYGGGAGREEEEEEGGSVGQQGQRSEGSSAGVLGRMYYSLTSGGLVHTFLSRYWAPYVVWLPVRAAILALWLTALARGFWGATQLPLGLEQQLVLPTGSYLVPYFSAQSRLGDAGPPMYLVLQNVDYGHPNATSAIATVANTLASQLSDVLVPPLFSWVGDYASWNSNSTRTMIASNPSWGCPMPLLDYGPQAAPLASRVAQFLYGVPVDSVCCQGQGYCGGQYSTDVRFLWGIPKAQGEGGRPVGAQGGEEADMEEEAFVIKVGHQFMASRRPESVSSLPSSTSAIDDGGCDLSYGLLRHDEVVRAVVGGGHGGMGERVTLPLQAVHERMRARILQAATVSYGSNVTLMPCHILTSRLRGQHVPLRTQADFINSMQKVQAAVDTLQAALLPPLDLAQYGISGYGPLSPAGPVNDGGAWSNSSAPAVPAAAYQDDNGHTWWLPPAPGRTGGATLAFPYSLVYVYYEQYSYIRGVALSAFLTALSAVFLAAYLVTNMRVAAVTAGLVASITISLVGWVWTLNPSPYPAPLDPRSDSTGGPYGVSVNAVSVVNGVTALGLGVEFVVHVASAFFQLMDEQAERAAKQGVGQPSWSLSSLCSPSARASRRTLAQQALVRMGSPVVTGITLTKLAGVIVLSTAPSQLFRLYYFRMYLGIIVLGAFHGLALLPALLAT